MFFRDSRRRTNKTILRSAKKNVGRLRVEPLETRRMLATFIVNNVLDGPVTQADDLPGSLRQAIFDANANSGPDTIKFNNTLSGQTLTLTHGELVLNDALTVDALTLAEDVIINADQLSRVFNITTASGDFAFLGLTMTGGRTTAAFADGGAINSSTSGLLTFDQCTISGNEAAGTIAAGGGIFASGDVVLTSTAVTDNTSEGSGGGVRAVGLTVDNGTISQNSSGSYGGAIRAFTITLTNTTISGNTSDNDGGGIRVSGAATLTSSTLSENFGGGFGGVVPTTA